MIVCLDANIVIDNFSALDALHLGAAVEHGCARFLTNDAPLKRFPDILVEILA
jgi:predicted nucleic acid-binding protein